MRYSFILLILCFFVSIAYSAEMGKFEYKDFYTPKRCMVCHSEIYQEWQKSLNQKDAWFVIAKYIKNGKKV